IRKLASRGPLLLAIDDYQWLDRPTARVVEFALRRLTTETVRAIVASRPPSADWERILGRDVITRMAVGPLSLSALYHLLYERLGVALGRPTLLRVHETSGGNPFYALELTRELLEHREDEYRGRPLPLPEGLNELLQRRLGRLPVRTRRLLFIAAAMPSPRLEDLLMVEPDTNAAKLDDELEQVERAGIIELKEGVIRFAHPMLAAAAYSAATRSERDRLHSLLAVSVADPEEASRHLSLATHGPDSKAAANLDEASARALARGATDVAALFAEQALRTTPVDHPEDIYRRALIAGDRTLSAGNQTRARELFDRAVMAANPGDQMATALLRRAELATPLGYATALCEQALLETEDAALQSRIYRTIGGIAYALGDVAAAERTAREAVRLAEGGDDRSALGLALAELAHWTFCGGGGYREDVFDRAVSLDASAGAISPRSHYAKITMDAGHLDNAKAQLVRLLEEATFTGSLQGVAAHHLHLAQLMMWMGNFALAIEHADESLLLHEYAVQPSAPRHVKAMSQACLGQIDSARSEAKAGLAEAERSENVLLTIYNLHVLGFAELSLGNHPGARDYLDRAIKLHRPRWNREFGDAHFVPDQIESLVALGELDQAEDLVVWMEEVGATTRRPWTLATGSRSRAVILAARGSTDEADQALGDSLAHHDDLPMPFELARTLLIHGSLQRRRKQRAAATESLSQAHQLFLGMGATLWAAKAVTELDRIGVRSRAQPALTPVERNIASLASQGHSNREIADLLFVSRKTVESNLTHIYRKLGIRSRAQLGAALDQAGMKVVVK
ncbi:MAG TPA: LuxR C-terminal-related transcriptional regulator, partial [Acidimicrobiia bacterium]|nr:LuxR C-terminal-related transcriptional regulator [Acidimicrobiia bacterium]